MLLFFSFIQVFLFYFAANIQDALFLMKGKTRTCFSVVSFALVLLILLLLWICSVSKNVYICLYRKKKFFINKNTEIFNTQGRMNSFSAGLNFLVWIMLVLKRIISAFATLSETLLALSQKISSLRSLFRVLLMAYMLSRIFRGLVSLVKWKWEGNLIDLCNSFKY